MDSQDQKNEQWAEPGKSVYIPDDLYHSFNNIFELMKDAQRELHKVREEMKPMDWGQNGESMVDKDDINLKKPI